MVVVMTVVLVSMLVVVVMVDRWVDVAVVGDGSGNDRNSDGGGDNG